MGNKGAMCDLLSCNLSLIYAEVYVAKRLAAVTVEDLSPLWSVFVHRLACSGAADFLQMHCGQIAALAEL